MKKNLLLFLFVTQAILFAQYEKDFKFTSEDMERTQCESDPEAAGEILFQLVKDRIDWDPSGDPYLLREVEMVYKIYNLEKLPSDLKNISIPLYKGSGGVEAIQRFKAISYSKEGEQIKEDGRTKKSELIEEEVNEQFYKKTAAIKAIKSGSIVEVKYEIRSPYIQHVDRVYIQNDVPVRFSQYFISFNGQFNYSVDIRGEVSPEYTEGDFIQGGLDQAYRMYTFKNIPAHYERPFMFNSNNARSSIHHVLAQFVRPNGAIKNFTVSWDDVIRDLMKASSFGGELVSFSGLREVAPTIYDQDDSDIEKVKKIFDWTKSKIRWNGNFGKSTENGLRKTLRNKEGNMGDKNLVLVMLLREAGLEAYPLVFRTVAGGKLNYASPTSTDLNAVMATAVIGGNTIFMDATAKHSNLNVLPNRDLNFYGFQIVNETTFNELFLVNQIPSQDKDYLSYTINEDGTMAEGVYKNVFGHYYSMLMSERLEKLGVDMTAYFNSRFDIKATNAKKKPGKNGFKLLLSCDFEKVQPIEKVGSKWILNPLLFLQAQTINYKEQDGERKYPLEFETPYVREKIVSVSLPKGYSVKELPSPKSFVVDKLMDYEISFEYSNNKLVVRTKETLNASFLKPEMFDKVLAFKKNIVQSEDVALILSKN